MRNKFHQVVLHGETLVFFAAAIVATVAKVESGSTFRETCLAAPFDWYIVHRVP